MASSDAKPFPLKNIAYRVYFPILDADGDLVTGAAGLDSERSLDGATFADCTNEATEVATSSGMYYLDLTTTEMNTDCTIIIIKTSTSGAKTTPIVLYPVESTDIHVNVKAISDDTTTPDNLELDYDGTGYAKANSTIGTCTTNTDLVSAAAIVNEWESQSQTDPTGFHVNVKEVNGTAQTANDVGGDVNEILTDTGTTLDTLIKDIPTVAEFEARTIVTADYPTETEMTAAFTEIKGGTWAAGTDTLEHIRDKETDIETDTAVIGALGAGLTDLGGMSAGMQTEVNNQIVDVIKTDTISEMAQGIPSATPTLEDAIMYLYMYFRNEVTQTNSTLSLKNDAGTVIAKATVSDDNTTFTKGELVSGP